MKGFELLQLIWQNAVMPAQSPVADRFARLIGAMVPTNVVHLVAAAPMSGPAVYTDETEVMPGVSLGDVLAEELGLDVPYGTIVVVESQAAHAAGRGADGCEGELSQRLGAVVGRILLDIVDRGIFPIDRESDALYLMGCAYHRMAGGAACAALGLVSDRFRLGLAAALGEFWTGQAGGSAGAPGLFLTSDALVCPETQAFLRAVDKGFTGTDPRRVSANMMIAAGADSHDGWLDCVQMAVTGHMGLAKRSLSARDVKQS